MQVYLQCGWVLKWAVCPDSTWSTEGLLAGNEIPWLHGRWSWADDQWTEARQFSISTTNNACAWASVFSLCACVRGHFLSNYLSLFQPMVIKGCFALYIRVQSGPVYFYNQDQELDVNRPAAWCWISRMFSIPAVFRQIEYRRRETSLK